MKKIIVLVVLAFGSLALSAGRPYGDAGCGLGSIVMGADGSQLSAFTTNQTVPYGQLFAITSGTSNCTDAPADGGSAEEAQLRYFIEVNRVSLASDISRGQGESIEHLSAILKCDSKQVGTTLKKNYESIYKNDNLTVQEIQSSILNILGVSKAAQGSCTKLG